jgi:hypothetical protein
MQKSSQKRTLRQSVDAQLALAARVLKSVHMGIDEQIERARDLEVEHAIALYKAGKNPIVEGVDLIAEARRRLG